MCGLGATEGFVQRKISDGAWLQGDPRQLWAKGQEAGRRIPELKEAGRLGTHAGGG